MRGLAGVSELWVLADGLGRRPVIGQGGCLVTNLAFLGGFGSVEIG